MAGPDKTTTHDDVAPGTGSPSRIAAPVGWLRARLRRYRLARQLMSMDRRDYERAMADLGLGPGDLDTVLRGDPDSKALLDRMMAHVGIDAGWLGTHPRARRELERTCALCGERRRCRHWMKTRQPASAYRAFCPNASSFDETR